MQLNYGKVIIVFLFATLLSANTFADDSKIKKSANGLCHGEDSQYFERITISSPSDLFDSYEDCIDAEGTLPKNLNNSGALNYYNERLKKESIKVELKCESGNTSECKDLPKLTKDAAGAEKRAADATEFAGFRFGVGIALTRLSSTDTIDDISIVNGLVSVNQSSKNHGTLMLETHQFIFTGTNRFGNPYGHGPFLAISIADEEGSDPLSSYAVGYMIGFKKEDSSDSWNIGFGGFINTKATVLRSGISDGQATTITDSENLTQDKDKYGWMLMFSSTW